MRKNVDVDRIPAAAFDKMKDKAAARGEPINNTELMVGFRAEGGGLFHVRPEKIPFSNGKYTRGMTVAYKVLSGRIELATAVQHRNDSFTKKIGTLTAIDHFRKGKTVCIPVRDNRPIDTLQAAFGFLG